MTVLLLLLLLGTEPNETIIKRMVGPFLTDEKCEGLVDRDMRREPNHVYMAIWDFAGHKVCIEVLEIDCRPGDLQFGSATGASPYCGRPDKVISRHCWCAEEVQP